jgi:hypothetical protein
MEKRIKPYFGGLGDHLQFSTIAEKLHSKGLTAHLHSDAVFSNNEIEDIVYGCNPFISGKSGGSWDFGDGSLNWNYQHTHKSYIKNIELASGLDPTNDFPKVYYEPKKIGDFDVIIDTGSVCLRDKIDYASSTKIIRDLLSTELKGSKALIVKTPYIELNNHFPELEIYTVNNLRGYIDLIYSSKNYISFLSGGHALASSIKHLGNNFSQFCIIPEHLPGLNRGDSENMSFYEYHVNKGFWTFPGVNYLKY